jgi:hypothetical protein
VSSTSRRQQDELLGALNRNSIYPSFICYAGYGNEGFFRFALSSEHKAQEMGLLAEVIRDTLVGN